MTDIDEAPRRVRAGAPPGLPSTARLLRGRDEATIDQVVRVLAAASVVVLAMRIVLPQNVFVGYLVSAAFAPVWIGVVRRYRFGPLVLGTGLLAVAASLWLQVAGAGTREVDSGIATSTTVLLVGSLLGIGLLLWARTVLQPSTMAFWFGVGLILSIDPTSSLYHSNPWKFGFYFPLAITTLAIARMTRRWWVEILVLLALTGVSAVNDSRSAFGLLLLAAILLVAQLPVFRAGHRGSALLVFIGLVAVSAVVWVVGQAAILGGYLGQATQARSLDQVQASGSLILGGRPELAATLALMRSNPWGFGAGISPSWSDIQIAKQGLADIGYAPDNNYVDTYMFGGHFELHSIFGDLWAEAGVVGLLFVAVVVVGLLWSLSRRIADGTASGIGVFMTATAVWFILFGPWLTDSPFVVLAVALVAVPKARHQFAANSTTVSDGPLQRIRGLRPAASKTASSADAPAAG